MVTDSPRSSIKCISFKLSRIRFVTEPEVQCQELVVTGSWMEETNRICLWRYDCADLIESGQIKPESEAEDDLTAGMLGDSADDPRLVHSILHPGWVQDLKVHHSTQRIFSASSLGTLQIFRAESDSNKLSRVTSEWMPFVPDARPSHLPIALASLCLSADGNQAYAGDDLGRLAIIQVDRIPGFLQSLSKQDSKNDRSAVIQTGTDITTVNALEHVDNSTLASVNQLGQLKVWDLRCGLGKPQQRLLRPGETQPLYCLSRHPGQPHLMAVGGVDGSSAAAYIWDLRAQQYPLTEVGCEGKSVWEVSFHPRQPKHLFLATETAGLLRVSCRGDADTWTGFKGSRRKLTVSSVLPGATEVRSVISFDLSYTRLICGHSDSTVQSMVCDTFVY
ncbi:unnamed protein product [Calicophoron daubneyi]|uniref:Nucleoporin Nup43 n=1 Tax=Calicophoron daubneyi TaxID=300641 RepID=A0AAV2T4D8_CALDB